MKNNMTVVLEYLEKLASKDCGEYTWTEYHWREANEVLLCLKLELGLDSLERIYGKNSQPEE